jgi:uncharacterized membrane protein
MWYEVLKLLHVLAAIVAVGANITYGVWIMRGSRDPKTLSFALKGIKLIDDRMANPAYGLLLATGIGMALVGKIPATTPWLLCALVLYVAVVLLGLLGYTPVLKKQIRVLERARPDSSEHKTLADRGRVLGIVLGVLTLGIVVLMVLKPPLWG